MKTKGQLISDIEMRMTGGDLKGNFEITRDYIGYLLDVVSNDVMSKYLSAQTAAFNDIDGRVVKKSEKKDISSIEDEIVVDISDIDPLPVKAPDRDRAILRIRLSGNPRLITIISPDDADYMRYLRWSAPSRENMAAYIEGDEIHILGVDGTFETGTVTVFYVKVIDTQFDDDDTEYPIFEDVMSQVLDEVDRRIRLSLGQIQMIENNELLNYRRGSS